MHGEPLSPTFVPSELGEERRRQGIGEGAGKGGHLPFYCPTG